MNEITAQHTKPCFKPFVFLFLYLRARNIASCTGIHKRQLTKFCMSFPITSMSQWTSPRHKIVPITNHLSILDYPMGAVAYWRLYKNISTPWWRRSASPKKVLDKKDRSNKPNGKSS